MTHLTLGSLNLDFLAFADSYYSRSTMREVNPILIY